VLYLEGFIQDITAHKEAVEALTEREERFRRFFEENGCAMLLVDPASGAIVDANDAAASFYAIGREELIGRLTGEMSTLGSEESALDRQLALGKKRRVFNYRIRLKSGEERAVEAYASPVSLGGKQVLFCIVHDITERLRTEEALRESLETLKEAQTVGALGSYVLDIRTGVWTSSDLLDELFGIDESYATTVDGWTALIHPGDRAMMASYFANEVIGGKKTFDKEYRIVHQSDGTERWVHGRGKLEFDALGRPVKMRGVIRDITERKQAELKLRASEERYRATFEQAAVGITHTSFDGKFLRCNARFAEIIGYPLEEIPGMSFHQITAPEDQAHSEKVRLQPPQRRQAHLGQGDGFNAARHRGRAALPHRPGGRHQCSQRGRGAPGSGDGSAALERDALPHDLPDQRRRHLHQPGERRQVHRREQEIPGHGWL
jgi:PAS domain S-box-containing protein